MLLTVLIFGINKRKDEQQRRIKNSADCVTLFGVDERRHLEMSEHDEQVKLFTWASYLETQIPELKMMFHIPNGGHRYKAVAVKMKAEGVKAGVPDIFLAVPRSGGFHGLFIEMKAGRNKTSEKQNEWIAKLIQSGYLVVVCYGFEEAKREILDYLDVEDSTEI